MVEEKINPFEAPQSGEDALAINSAENSNRIPGSVLVASGCIALVVLFELVIISAATINGHSLTTLAWVAILGPMVAGLMLLCGFWFRIRFARLLARALATFVLLTAALLFIATTVEVIVFVVRGTTEAARTQFIRNAEFPPDTSFAIVLLAGASVPAVPAFFAYTIFASLGANSARQYFRLICVKCLSRRVRAANFVRTRMKCKDCGATW